MAQVKKSGGWPSEMGGTNYKSSGGKVFISGTEKGKGIPPGKLPSSPETKVNQVNVLGSGGSKGIPPSTMNVKYSSKQAAARDDE